MKKGLLILLLLYFTCIISLNAQQTIFKFIYCEWPDGCLTYENRGHYDHLRNYSHRDDNVYVRNLINQFNNYIRQYDAVSYKRGQQYNVGDYVYTISTSYNYLPGVSGKIPSENYTIHVCSIWRISGSRSSSGFGNDSNLYKHSN